MGKHPKPSRAAKNIAALGLVAAVPAGALALAPPAVAAELPPDSIVQCESGGDPRAQNPVSTASGKYQMIDGTWKAYGGGQYAAKARLATEAQQDAVAAKLWAAEGSAPWNASKHCWGGKSMAPVESMAKAETSTPVATTRKNKVVETKQSETKEKPVETYQALPKVTPRVPEGARFTKDSQGEYTVKSGDTLSHIAVQHGTTVQAIVELNKDTIEHQDWVFEGEKLRLK